MNYKARIVLVLSLFVLTRALAAGESLTTEHPEGRPSEAELRMSISATVPKEAEGATRFRVTIENTGAQDVILNLGAMLDNGKILLPQAIRLILTDSTGQTLELHFSDRRFPCVAGRVDDYSVPLRVGSVYTVALNLNDYWCPETKEFVLKLAPGEYRVRAELTGQGAQHVNLDTEGVRLLNFWKGKLESDPTQFRIGERD